MKQLLEETFMKKVPMALALVATIILIGACGVNDKKQNEDLEDSQSETSLESSKGDTKVTTNEEETSIFTGILTEDAQLNDGNDKTIRLVLTDIEAVEDPDEMEKTMKNDGVVLNISEDQLANGLTEKELKKGDKVQFSLKSMPVMTMSIPPQIPGMSVKSIEKI